MKTSAHLDHIKKRISHNNCRECRADTERRFLSPQWLGYQYVSDYLAWANPRFEAIRAGVNPGNWRNDFQLALDKRITLKVAGETGRKQCNGYLERLGQFPRSTDANYLRQFAKEGASALKP